MARMEKFMTPAELRSVANILDTLAEAWSKINDESVNVSIAFFEDDKGEGVTDPVYDSNGEIIGHVGYGDGSFVMYLESDDDA